VGSGTFLAYGAVASSLGELFIAGTFPDGIAQVRVFPQLATGQGVALRAFALPSGNLPVASMTADSNADLIVAGGGGVSIFLPSANVTDSTPIYTFALPSGEVPAAVAVDASENIYVACKPSATGTLPGSIFVYAQQSNGSFALTRTITASAFLAGIAADASGDVFVVENTSAANAAGTANTVTLAEFASGANGAAAPLKTISGSATGMTFGGAVKLDSAGNAYLVNISITGTAQSPVTTPSVLIFGPTASGNEPPAATLTSAAWTAPGSQLTVQ
jgi:hypothetical protein